MRPQEFYHATPNLAFYRLPARIEPYQVRSRACCGTLFGTAHHTIMSAAAGVHACRMDTYPTSQPNHLAGARQLHRNHWYWSQPHQYAFSPCTVSEQGLLINIWSSSLPSDLILPQGAKGLFLAGMHCAGHNNIDNHEAAIISGLRVAGRLAPESQVGGPLGVVGGAPMEDGPDVAQGRSGSSWTGQRRHGVKRRADGQAALVCAAAVLGPPPCPPVCLGIAEIEPEGLRQPTVPALRTPAVERFCAAPSPSPCMQVLAELWPEGARAAPQRAQCCTARMRAEGLASVEAAAEEGVEVVGRVVKWA